MNSQAEIEKRISVLRSLINRKIPTWELVQAMRNVKIDNVQPYATLDYRTFKRDLAKLAKEERQWLNDVQREEWLNEVTKAVRFIHSQQREFLREANDAMNPPTVRVDAREKAIECETMALQVLHDGLNAMVIKREPRKEPQQENTNKPMFATTQ